MCINLLVRFPRTDHETGVDSFFVHNLATAISDTGHLPWVLNPLGYFGWYPLSYPNAGPLLISGLSQLAGWTEEGSILALSLLYGVLGVGGGFVMARAFRRDDIFALTVATVFSLAPRFMNFTLWSASSRNLFMVLIPLLLWALIRTFRKPTVPNLIMLLSVLVIMIATHRLTILLAVVVLAFVVAYVFVLLHRVVRVQFPKILLSARFRRWAPALALLFIAAIAVFMIQAPHVLDEYSSGELCSGETTQAQVCNLTVSITRSVGLALPFALVGVFDLVRSRNKGFPESFLILALLALTPTLFLRQYTGFYILPFLALLAAYGVLSLAKIRRARGLAPVALAVVLITGFSVFVLQIEVERGTSMESGTYSTALYLRTMREGNFVANDGLMGIRISAISGRGCLPVGGAGTTHQSPELLIMGAINASEVFAREGRVPLASLTIEDDSPFYLEGVDARTEWIERILQVEVGSVNRRLVDKYNVHFYVENEGLRGRFAAYGNVYPEQGTIVFADSVHAGRYKIYDGSSEDVFLAFSP